MSTNSAPTTLNTPCNHQPPTEQHGAAQCLAAKTMLFSIDLFRRLKLLRGARSDWGGWFSVKTVTAQKFSKILQLSTQRAAIITTHALPNPFNYPTRLNAFRGLNLPFPPSLSKQCNPAAPAPSFVVATTAQCIYHPGPFLRSVWFCDQ